MMIRRSLLTAQSLARNALPRPVARCPLRPSLLPTTNSIRLKTSETSNVLQPARVKSAAPTFSAKAVVNGQISDIALESYQGKYVVLFFYPLDFTFVCPTEIVAFDDHLDKFLAINTEVIGVSVDSEFAHLAWTQIPRDEGGIGKIRYPLVADLTKSISSRYNVLLPEAGIALRGTFIIDPSGVLRHISINDAPVGRNVEETLRLVEALQFTDTHGEVCPANWTKGQRTMKADPVESKEYFKAANKA